MDRKEEKRFVRRAVFFSCAVAVLLSLVLILARAYWPTITLLRVSGMIDASRIDDALTLLEDMEVERADRDAVDAQRYRAAAALESQGRREEALALFNQLEDYADARIRVLQIRYEQAEEALTAGDVAGAAETFYLLGGYRDAATRYRDCMETLYPTLTPAPTTAPTLTPATTFAPTTAPTLTPTTTFTPTPAPTPTSSPVPASADLPGAAPSPRIADAYTPSSAVRTVMPTTVPTATPTPTSTSTPAPTPSPTPALTPPPTPSPVPTTQAEGIAVGRAQTPRGILALGYRHTVGLLADGTVAAVGLNDAGQCDVDEWVGVIQVAAGAAHTLALREDGTVLSTGDNQYGQCDVSQWRDVVQVAAGAYDSFGLCQDGSLVHCGWHEYAELSKWHDLKQIAAGSYGLIALYDGGALSTHPSMRLSGIFVDADAARGYAVGLREDGTLAGANVTLPDWQGIVAISAGDGGILALDALGDAHAWFFRAPAPQLPVIDGRIIAVEAGAAHYALLMSDGQALCFGEDDLGQCRTENWRLRTAN